MEMQTDQYRQVITYLHQKTTIPHALEDSSFISQNILETRRLSLVTVHKIQQRLKKTT